MALSDNLSNLGTKAKVFKDPDLSNAIVDNVLGTSGSIKVIRAVNADSNLTYFKAYDANNPTSGTDEPDFIVPVAASSNVSIYFVNGLTFSNSAKSLFLIPFFSGLCKLSNTSN